MANAPPGEDPILVMYFKTREFPSSQKAWTPKVAMRWAKLLSEMLRDLRYFYDPNDPDDIEIRGEYREIIEMIKKNKTITEYNIYLDNIKALEERIMSLITLKMIRIGYSAQLSTYIASTVVSPDEPVNMNYRTVKGYNERDAEND